MIKNPVNIYISELAEDKEELYYTWDDIAQMTNNEFGLNLTGDACRKRARNMKVLKDSEKENEEYFNMPSAPIHNNEENSYVEDILHDNRKLLQDIRDERAQVSAIYRRFNREDSIKEMAYDAAAIIALEKPLLPKDKEFVKITPSDEALLLVSDWHYGIDINNYVNIFNPDICRDRVAELIENVISKVKQNKIKKLNILNLGDMIAGIIHLQLRINSRIDVLTQIMEVSEILAEMIFKFSEHVNQIDYYSVLDNHSRINPNKKESIQLESLARITHWYLKERFKDFEDVNIIDNFVDEDIAFLTIGDGFNIVGVHGDKDKWSKVLDQLPGFFQSEDINLICTAHKHHFSADEKNKVIAIANGSLMGTDEFAFQLRLSSAPSQTFITFKETPFGVDVDGIYKLNSYIFG